MTLFGDRGLYRGHQVTMRSLGWAGILMKSNLTGILIKRGIRVCDPDTIQTSPTQKGDDMKAPREDSHLQVRKEAAEGINPVDILSLDF